MCRNVTVTNVNGRKRKGPSGFEGRKCRIYDRRVASGEEDLQSPVLANLIAPLNSGTMIQTFASFFFANHRNSEQFRVPGNFGFAVTKAGRPYTLSLMFQFRKRLGFVRGIQYIHD